MWPGQAAPVTSRLIAYNEGSSTGSQAHQDRKDNELKCCSLLLVWIYWLKKSVGAAPGEACHTAFITHSNECRIAS